MHASPEGVHAAGALSWLPGHERWLPRQLSRRGGFIHRKREGCPPGPLMTNTVLGPREELGLRLTFRSRKKNRRELRLRSPVSGFLNICQIELNLRKCLERALCGCPPRQEGPDPRGSPGFGGAPASVLSQGRQQGAVQGTRHPVGPEGRERQGWHRVLRLGRGRNPSSQSHATSFCPGLAWTRSAVCPAFLSPRSPQHPRH